MKPLRWLFLLTLLLPLLQPGLAKAAPRPIPLAEYQEMLRRGVGHLERAEQLATSDRLAARRAIDAAAFELKGQWLVEGPGGTVQADLTPLAHLLGRAGPEFPEPHTNLTKAVALAREHLVAAEALEHASRLETAGAREVLTRTLEAGRARSLIQRLRERLREMILRPVGSGLSQVAAAPPWLYWAGGVIAALALAWIGFSLYRSLSGHAAPGEAILGQGREGQSVRPATPAELRTLARQVAEGGRHLEALRMAHLALLRQYDNSGLIRYIPAQTNREHERQLQRHYPELAKQFRSLNDLVDSRLYSGQGASIEDFLTVDGLVDQLWREGDARSRSAEATPGRSSSASSR